MADFYGQFEGAAEATNPNNITVLLGSLLGGHLVLRNSNNPPEDRVTLSAESGWGKITGNVGTLSLLEPGAGHYGIRVDLERPPAEEKVDGGVAVRAYNDALRVAGVLGGKLGSVACGVYGEVYDDESVKDAWRAGVWGFSTQTENGIGVKGNGGTGVDGSSSDGVGVNGTGNIGVKGEGYTGVRGVSSTIGEPSKGNGVSGSSDTGNGVFGESLKGNGISGRSVNGTGVSGEGKGIGVYGHSSEGDAIYGVTEGENRNGVFAFSAKSDGVQGWSGSVDPKTPMTAGVSGSGYVGVSGYSTKYIGVYGEGPIAGYFKGILYSTIKGFRIDHPLEPTTKYLTHSCVESSEMLNLYSGNAILDARGEVWIDLPHWFGALNTDFRYQLTPIGGAAPNLHIAEEVAENRFKIAGGRAKMKVSWQVTGTRNDAYAKAHPMQVEVEKEEGEKGTYLHPVEHGEPEEKGTRFEEIRRRRESLKHRQTELSEKAEKKPHTTPTSTPPPG